MRLWTIPVFRRKRKSSGQPYHTASHQFKVSRASPLAVGLIRFRISRSDRKSYPDLAASRKLQIGATKRKPPARCSRWVKLPTNHSPKRFWKSTSNREIGTTRQTHKRFWKSTSDRRWSRWIKSRNSRMKSYLTGESSCRARNPATVCHSSVTRWATSTLIKIIWFNTNKYWWKKCAKSGCKSPIGSWSSAKSAESTIPAYHRLQSSLKKVNHE